MFDELEQPEEKKPTDYTGVIIGAAMLPVIFLFSHFGKQEQGLVISIVLGATFLAVKIRWDLRKHLWFWATIVSLLAMQFYLLFAVQWPQGWLASVGRLHAVGLLPIGLAVLLITLGFVALAGKLFSKGSASDSDEESSGT